MTKNKKKNELRAALNRELKDVTLSDRMKRDILYNAQHSKAPARRKHGYAYMVAAAAMLVALLGTTLLMGGGRVFPDYVESQPGKSGAPIAPPVAAEGEATDHNEYIPEEGDPVRVDGYIDAEPTPEPTYGYIEAKPTPVYGTDLFMQFDSYDAVVPAAIGETVWATPGGRFYHLVPDCSGMQNASRTSRNEATLAGKQPCPVCIAFVTPEVVEVTPEPTEMPVPSYVGTEHGTYYHLNEHCSGMQNAVWLSDLSGKQPCPVCIPHVTPTPMPVEVRSTPEPTETPVYRFYGTENGKYFHTDETCSGMQNAVWLSDLSGKQPCPVCIPYVTPTPAPVEYTATPEPTEEPANVIYDVSATPEPAKRLWYGMEHSLFFHRDINCSGMENASVLDDLTGMLPCPDCVVYISDYYGTEHGIFYHLDEHCSGMQNAVILGDLSEKQPCPVCILDAAPIAHEEPDAFTIELTRYTCEDGCIIELETASDPNFSYIYDPDVDGWYVDDVDMENFSFADYLAHRLSPKHIAMLESAYEKDGKVGFEIREVITVLEKVNTEFSGDSGDVPAGHEYRFDSTENPSAECTLYILDRPYEGETGFVHILERIQQYWFDGENVYRRVVPEYTTDYITGVEVIDGGEVFPIEDTLECSGIEVNATGYALQNNHYAIMEYDESLDLSDSELISVSGEVFKADMTTDPTFHVNKVMGWRYPIEMADYIDILWLGEGENAVPVPMNPEASLSLAVAKLAELLNECGVTDAETVNNTVASLIIIGENGDITAMASQPVRDELLKAGLTEEDIASNYMVNSILAILDGDMDYDPAG